MGSGGVVAMKVLNYKKAADRIECERWQRLSALRDNVLIAIAQRLRDFKPNTPLNIKHPWKLAERYSLRAWCPRHDGRWVKLIVRVDEDGQLTFDCDAGCSGQEIRDQIGVPVAVVVERPSTAGLTMSAGRRRRSNVIDALNRFSQQRSQDDDRPAA